ncbi:MAG: c-type cytochrome [Bacteroidota bacterium]
MKKFLLLTSLVVLGVSIELIFESSEGRADRGPLSQRPQRWEEAIEAQIPENPELVNRGKEIYENVCFLCHGEKGGGDGKVAQFMVTKPRAFTSGVFKVRTTPSGSLPTDADLFRTITFGFPEYGMPSFYFLTAEERWGLVYYIKRLFPGFEEEVAEEAMTVEKGPLKTPELIARGKNIFVTFGCIDCHGEEGRGDGPSAPTLTDDWGNRIYALDFTQGEKMFKGGANGRDIVRTLLTGMNGTPMPSYMDAFEGMRDSLWGLAYFIEDLAERGEAERRAEWEAFYRLQKSSFSLESAHVAPSEENWDDEISAKFQKARSEVVAEKACLACHEGIEDINPKMEDYLFAIGAGHKGRLCVVCHEGNPDATTKKEAHEGMFPNPGSMWVVSVGKGCGKCHSDRNALISVQTLPLPHPVGGSLLEVESTSTDTSGATGRNHVYRMQRALMGLEFGKASHTLMSNGVVPKGDYVYSDFDMDDPDGPVPTVGTETYKKWISKALEAGAIKRVVRSKQIPNFARGDSLWNDPEKAAISDMYRKQCARCHVWEEGRRKRGDLRAGGCAACHVIYTNDGVYEGNDPTIPKDKGIHPIKHEITIKIPATQCTHCHTRGKRIGTTFVGMFEYDYKPDGFAPPVNEKGEPQDLLYTKDYLNVRKDIHFERGLECVDCHTSIDVHGDGNIYPTTLYQVEIQCADCHGTPDKYPWELPVGWGTRVTFEGERGTLEKDGKEYLLTSRGNSRVNLERRGDSVILTSFFSEKEHEVPLLKEKNLNDDWKTEQGKVAMATVSQHLNKLECYACHSTWAPQCFGCHIVYDKRKQGTDWVTTALNYNQKTGKQQITKTAGDIKENRGYLRWEEPILGVNLKGKVTPVIPGCQVIFSYIDENGNVVSVNKVNKTSDGLNAPTLAPVQPHANTMPARTCESCHTRPKTIGYGTMNSRSAAELLGDEPLFGNNAEGVYGDIPNAETGKWQMPKIPDFPYAWDQLVTRSGQQVQNMPHVEDRPLSAEERDKVEREGLCVACHKHYNTPTWENIRNTLKKKLGLKDGMALTPQQHDQAVEEALKALAK